MRNFRVKILYKFYYFHHRFRWYYDLNVTSTKNEKKNENKILFQTTWDDCFELDKRCDPVTDDVEDDESIIIEGTVDDDGEVDKDISSALVPDPKRYSFPRHLIVDEPVNALK